jgi:hypothetical protein
VAELAVAIFVGIFIKLQNSLALILMEQNIYLPYLLSQKWSIPPFLLPFVSFYLHQKGLLQVITFTMIA